MVNIPLFIGFQPSVWWLIGFHSHRMLDMLGSMRKNWVDCLLSKFDPGRVVAVRSCWRRSDLWVWDPGDNMFWWKIRWSKQQQTATEISIFTVKKHGPKTLRRRCALHGWARLFPWAGCTQWLVDRLWAFSNATTAMTAMTGDRNQVLMEKLGETMENHPW